MKKRGNNTAKKIGLTILAIGLIAFIGLPLIYSLASGIKTGNVALIPIEGVIIASSGTTSYLSKETVSSQTIVQYLKDADETSTIRAIVIVINSPGGSAVASDEIAAQIKRTNKPVVAVIKEVGASGGYWVASAADKVIANRMSLTGSIGVLSSYLEFSELMKQYGVNYERLVAGKYKDMGTPFRKLTAEEEKLLQSKLDKIHSYFITEIAQNRKMPEGKVKELATGEVYLGVEALKLGLVDELGDLDTAEQYLKNRLNLTSIEYAKYEPERTFLESVLGVFSDYFFRVGEGIGSALINNNKMIWV